MQVNTHTLRSFSACLSVSHTHIVTLTLLVTNTEAFTARTFKHLSVFVTCAFYFGNRLHLFELNVFGVIQMTHGQMNLLTCTSQLKHERRRQLGGSS